MLSHYGISIWIVENVIWPEFSNIIPTQFLDSDYDSVQSTASEASYIALMNGLFYSPNKKCLSKDFVNFKYSPYDEFDFFENF